MPRLLLSLNSRNLNLILLGIASFFLLLSYVLHPRPVDIDSATYRDAFATFCFFVFWTLSVLQWGNFFAVKLKFEDGILFSIIFGMAWIHLLGFFLTHLGLVGFENRYILIGLLAAGLALPFLNDKKRSKEFSFLKTKQEKIGAALAIIVFGSFFFKAFLVQGLTDAFSYHLPAPRLWVESGGYAAHPNLIAFHNAWYFEYLFIWGFLFGGASAGLGLIEGEVFGQLVHVLAGFLTAFMTFRFLEHLKFPFVWRLAASFVIFTALNMFVHLPLAYVDWAGAFWIMAGFLILVQMKRLSIKNSIVAGVCFGIATMTKIQIIIVIFIFLAVWILWRMREKGFKGWNWLHFFTALFSAQLILMLPIVLRNMYFMKYPLFPYFIACENTLPMSDYYRTLCYAYGGDIVLNLGLILNRMYNVFFDSAYNLGLLFFPLAVFKNKLRRGPITFLLVLAVAGCSYWAVIDPGPVFFKRWMSAPILLFPVVGIFSLLAVVEAFRSKRTELVGWGLVLLLSGQLFQYGSIQYFFTGPSVHDSLRKPEILGGAAKGWIRDNVPPEELILSTGDDLIYHLMGHNFDTVNSHPELYSLMMGTKPSKFFRELDKRKIKYILDSDRWDGKAWSNLQFFIKKVISVDKSSLVFDSRYSRVIYVPKFLESLRKFLNKPKTLEKS